MQRKMTAPRAQKDMFMKKNVETIMNSIRVNEEVSLAMTQFFECPTVEFFSDDYGVGVWINKNDVGVSGTDLELKNRISKYWDVWADDIYSELSKSDDMGKINVIFNVLVSFIAECEGIDLAA